MNFEFCIMQKSTTKDNYQDSSMFEESSELFVGDDLIQESLQVLAEGCQPMNVEYGKFNIGKAAGKSFLPLFFEIKILFFYHEFLTHCFQ